MMKRVFLLFLSGIVFCSVASAQCDACPDPSGLSADFCYTDPEFPQFCAAFSLSGDEFVFQKKVKKKVKSYDLEVPSGTDWSPEKRAADLATDKKLGPAAAVFLEDALERFHDHKMLEKVDLASMQKGWTITSSGLAYKVLEVGTGQMAENGKTVSVHYTGYLIDGKKFDSSRDRGQEFKFPLGKGRVIKGWDEGVALMKTGDRFLFRIPSALGYGQRGFPGTIPPNATLFFDVQFNSVQ